MNLFNKLFKREFDWRKKFPECDHIIEFAFEVGGVKYYRFSDIYNLPFERGLMALAVYEETRMNCSKEYLEKHVEVMRELLRSKNIDIYKINQLNEQIAERLKISFDTPLLYKLASIVFFDKNENPALYEYDYCNKKIAFWKEHKGVADFFLQKPLQELIPFLNTLEFDFQKYSEMIEELDKVHSARLRVLESKS